MVSSEQYPLVDRLPDDEIDIADLLMVLWRYKRLIVGLAVFFVFVAAGSSLTKKRTYTAQTSIINMVDNRMLRSVQGFDFETMVQSPRNSILSAILDSQSLAENIVNKQGLLPLLFPKRWDDEAKTWINEDGKEQPSDKNGAMILRKMVRINANESNNTITISVTSRDPQLSATIANAYTKELDNYLKDNTFSSVQKSREFLEDQLAESKSNLEKLKQELEKFQKENGIFDLSKQIEASIEAYNTNAVLLDKYTTEAEMTESISSSQNPKVVNLRKYIETLQARMDQLKTGSQKEANGLVKNNEFKSAGESNNHYLLPLNNITELKLKMEKIHHDIENQQKIHDLFVDSYEKITIQEAKEKIFVTVLDKAEPPMIGNSRKILLKMIMGCFAGVFVGIFAAFMIEFYNNHLKFRFADISEKQINEPEPEPQKEVHPKPEPVRVIYRRESGMKTHLSD